MDLIIGAGITGLSYALLKGDSDYLVLETENEIGGYCRTTRFYSGWSKVRICLQEALQKGILHGTLQSIPGISSISGIHTSRIW